MITGIGLFVEFITIVLAVPILALSTYVCFELFTSLKYPKDLEKQKVHLLNSPKVSILISTFNEKFVIARSLEAIQNLEYPNGNIQVVVADDSNDETIQIIDDCVRQLNLMGIDAVVSRRPVRENYKCGALNKALSYVTGDYVLLLDADSIVPPDLLNKGIHAIENHPNAAFVSFRYGHLNRDQNMITKLFAMAQDLGDTTSKMGAYLIDAPFSSQGGFTLIRMSDLKEIGGWTNGRIADDTDISIKLYMKGKRGIYLSNVQIMSEDPTTLEAWKNQVARTSQGWWRCIATYWRKIITAKDMSLSKKLGIFLMLMTSFSSPSWIAITFLSAAAVILNVIPATDSIFKNPLFLAALTVPYGVTLLAAVRGLRVQNVLTIHNLLLIPVLCYTEISMVTLSSLGFFYGVFDRTGFFDFRTPHSGSAKKETDLTSKDKEKRAQNFTGLAKNDGNAIIEAILSVSGILLAILVMLHGMWFLPISMIGFAVATLKSMNLTKYFGGPIKTSRDTSEVVTTVRK